MSTPTNQKPLWRRITGSAWFHFLAACVVVGLLCSFVAKPGYITSGSMEETLQVGDRVLIDRISAPHRGDIIAFDVDTPWTGERPPRGNPFVMALRWAGEVTGLGPTGPNTMIKRIIATPGQTARCCSADGAVIVDGEALDEPYVYEDFPFVPGQLDCASAPRSMRCFDDVTVPQGAYLVLGDHRSASADSAAQCRVTGAPTGCWRWATRDGIVGRAVAILWPIDRWGRL